MGDFISFFLSMSCKIKNVSDSTLCVINFFEAKAADEMFQLYQPGCPGYNLIRVLVLKFPLNVDEKNTWEGVTQHVCLFYVSGMYLQWLMRYQ